jgi:Domain of unknown function (DUF4373)
MKWFKHESQARNDERISRLEDKAGLEGYGFYFKLLEIVASNMDSSNGCGMTYSLSRWGRQANISTKKAVFLLQCCHDVSLIIAQRVNDDMTVNIPNLLKYRDNHTKNLQATSKQELELELDKELDKEMSESVEGSQIPEVENNKKTHTQIQIGLIADGLKKIGMMPINPTLPKFIALLEAGATADEFVNTALEKRGTDKFNFSYLLTVMGNRRQEVASQGKLHKGAMPASTSREAGRNIAAKSIFTPENTKHLQGNNLNLMGVEHEVRAITN